MFKQYLQVTKPGIIFGNLISVIGGFLLASKGHIDYPLFVWTLLGVSPGGRLGLCIQQLHRPGHRS